jgi:hypothetical protein
MSDFVPNGETYVQTFWELAEIVNQQPEQTREQVRVLFGDYLHDIKHTLGLVTGANTVLRRNLSSQNKDQENLETLQIADQAAQKISLYLDLLAENFAGRINADVGE